MARATRSADEVIAGVGLLYVGTSDAILPTAADLFAAGVRVPFDPTDLDPDTWREIGYSESGATITTSVESESLEVAEELEPIGTTTTTRSGSVNFEMAQATAENLSLALNLGPLYTDGTFIEPPDPANEEYVKLILHTNQDAVWIFPRVKNTAEFSMARAKTGKTLIGVEMGIYRETGQPYFRVAPGDNNAV